MHFIGVRSDRTSLFQRRLNNTNTEIISESLFVEYRTKMPVCKYKREFSELTVDELKAVIKTWQPTMDLSKFDRKETLKLQAQEVLRSTASQTPEAKSMFYFEACDLTRATTNKKSGEIITADYNQSRPRTWNFNQPATSQERDDENLSEETRSLSSRMDENLDTAAAISAQAAQIGSLIDLLSKQKSNTVHEKFKIEYSESLGLPAFLRQIEEWAKLNAQGDRGKIRKACASLVLTKEGLAIRECLNDDENQSWIEFKQQLNELLGKDRAHYRKEFRNMKKNVYESFGAFLSRMTLNYRYAHSLDDAKLSEHDKTQIKLAFIEAIDYPVRAFLESEDYIGQISFSNVATRATQLQRAHQPQMADQINNLQRQSINAVTQPQQSEITQVMAEMRTQTAMMQKLIELVSLQQNQQKEDSRMPKRFPSKRLTPDEIEKRKQEICINYQYGNCRFGSRCYRKHEKN